MKKTLHVLAIIAIGAMIMMMTGCVSAPYSIVGESPDFAWLTFPNKWEAGKNGFLKSGLEWQIKLVSIEGYELPQIKEIDKGGAFSVRVPLNEALKITVHVTRTFHANIQPELIAKKAAQELTGVIDRDEDVVFLVPPLTPYIRGGNSNFRDYKIGFDDGDGVLSDSRLTAGDIGRADQGLFGKQALVLRKGLETDAPEFYRQQL
jgi:hypothetical protein